MNTPMDSWTSDLTQALDESQRYRRPFRKRAPNAVGRPSCGVHGSDESSSSVEETCQTGEANSQDNKSSMPLTDSDDGQSSCMRVPRYRIPRPARMSPGAAGLAESDSVNECFSPASRPTNVRRKPRYKRLALDSSSEICQQFSSKAPRWRAAPVLHRIHALNTPSSRRRSSICSGKRKRSREDRIKHDEVHHSSLMSLDRSAARARQRCSQRCSGSHHEQWSSEESDGGELITGRDADSGGCDLFTCDEGREADDEQSDWFAEGPGPVYGIPCRSLLWFEEKTAGGGLLSHRQRFQKIRERLLRREIRAGRRRLRDRRPGSNSNHSSVSETLSRFMQDPQACELQVQPTTLAECDQLQRLARLYSLQLRVADDDSVDTASQPVNSCFLTKTLSQNEGSEAAFDLLDVSVPSSTDIDHVKQVFSNVNTGSFPWGLPPQLNAPVCSKKRRKPGLDPEFPAVSGISRNTLQFPNKDQPLTAFELFSASTSGLSAFPTSLEIEDVDMETFPSGQS